MVSKPQPASAARSRSTADRPAPDFALSRRLNEETNAIAKFLEQNWEVKLENGSLREMVRDVLLAGLALGDRFGRERLRQDMERANGLIELANHVHRAKLPILELPLTPAPPVEFEPSAEQVEQTVKARFKLTAKPQRALPEDEYAEPTTARFDGVRLHRSLHGTPGFAATMSPETVRYHLARGRDPVCTMVTAILRQGMTLRIESLDVTYGSKIEAAVKQAFDSMAG